jgi:hypothetical protein
VDLFSGIPFSYIGGLVSLVPPVGAPTLAHAGKRRDMTTVAAIAADMFFIPENM